MKSKRRGLSVGLLMLLGTGTAWGQVTSSTITYQGQLSLNGQKVNQPCDFEFSLWDAAVVGTQLGTTILQPALQVEAGVFTTALDFGAENLQADPVWLQIQADCTGVPITLTPRQQITAAPFALHTKGIVVDVNNNASVDGIIESTTGGFKFPDGTAMGSLTEVVTTVTAGPGLTGGGSGGNVTLNVDAGTIVTGVAAGSGLTGGGSGGDVTLSVDASTIITGVAAGSGLTGGGSGGDVTLSVDASTIITGVTAGTGLTGGGSGGDVTLSVDAGTIITGVSAGDGLSGGGSGGDVTVNVDGTVSRVGHQHSSLKASDGNPSNALVVDAAGDVGIGNGVPLAKLDVDGGVRSGPGLRITQNDNQFLLVHNGGATEAGGISFNNVSDAQGRINFQRRTTSGGFLGTVMSLFLSDSRMELSGNAFKPGGGSWGVLSDRRLKKHIYPLRGALDRLLKLRGVSFEYKNPNSELLLPGQQIGMVAQDVEAVFPEWVSNGPDGYKAVNVHGFEALTVESFRQLRAEKDEEISALKERIDRLERLLTVTASNERGEQ